MRGGVGGTRAAYASNNTTALWRARSGGRAGRRIYKDDATTLHDLREVVTTLEETGRTARRVFGGAHPDVVAIEKSLREARVALRAHESPQSASGDA